MNPAQMSEVERPVRETSPKGAMTEQTLALENARFRGTGGVSAHRPLGFSPAFMDTETRFVYASRFADGRLAPFHVLDGLPDELLLPSSSGRRRIKSSVVSGFVREGLFYTRNEAAAHATAALDAVRQ